MNNIPDNLKDLTTSATDDFHEPFDLEENVNSQLNYLCKAQESVSIPNTPSVEEINIARGKEKNPNSLLADNNCEALTFPYLFPTDKYGYTVKRDIELSPVKYFNQRFLNFTQMFASEAGCIFYALSATQELKINSQINIALKKICTGQLIAEMLTNNFSDTISSFLSKDNANQFMGTIKGAPAYWKNFFMRL